MLSHLNAGVYHKCTSSSTWTSYTVLWQKLWETVGNYWWQHNQSHPEASDYIHLPLQRLSVGIFPLGLSSQSRDYRTACCGAQQLWMQNENEKTTTSNQSQGGPYPAPSYARVLTSRYFSWGSCGPKPTSRNSRSAEHALRQFSFTLRCAHDVWLFAAFLATCTWICN